MYLKNLLKYRNVWLGFAMILIVLFHSYLDFGIGILNLIKKVGYGSVDICFFASGIGCYYSLSANSSATSFLKRRLIRIMPTYLVFIVFWLTYKFAVNEFNIFMAIGNIFAVQNFTGLGNYFNWYISAILLFYILTPYLKRLVDKFSVFANLLMVVLLVIFSISFWGSYTYIITIARLPIYYLGIFVGKLCCQEKQLKPIYIISLIAMFIVGVAALLAFYLYCKDLLWLYGLHWYPFILITPPLCIGISGLAFIMEKTKACKWIVKIVSLIGKYSFEVYLIHIFFMDDIIPKFVLFFGVDMSIQIQCAGVVAIVLGCCLLSKLTYLCNCVFKKLSSKVTYRLYEKQPIDKANQND